MDNYHVYMTHALTFDNLNFMISLSLMWSLKELISSQNTFLLVLFVSHAWNYVDFECVFWWIKFSIQLISDACITNLMCRLKRYNLKIIKEAIFICLLVIKTNLSL